MQDLQALIQQACLEHSSLAPLPLKHREYSKRKESFQHYHRTDTQKKKVAAIVAKYVERLAQWLCMPGDLPAELQCEAASLDAKVFVTTLQYPWGCGMRSCASLSDNLTHALTPNAALASTRSTARLRARCCLAARKTSWTGCINCATARWRSCTSCSMRRKTCCIFTSAHTCTALPR